MSFQQKISYLGTEFARSILGALRWTRIRWQYTVRRWRTVPSQDAENVVVLSLGSLGRSVEVCRQAAQSGFLVHVFCHEFPVGEAPYARGWTKLDCRNDMSSALAICRTLDPAAILVESKNLLLPMQQHLASELNLRSVGELAASTSNSKIRLRECLDAASVGNTPWVRLADFSTQPIAFPLVAKPDLGTSSKGVVFINDEFEFNSNIHNDQRTSNDPSVGDEIVLEGYVKGRQFDLEGLAVDGEYFLLVVVEEFYESSPPYFPPTWFNFNPNIGKEMHSVLWTTTQKALKALGVRNGTWHMEQRVDSAGQVRVLDYSNRMGYNLLVSDACDASFAGNYVDLMTNPDYSWPVLRHRALLQVFIWELATLENYRALAEKYPEIVQSKSFRPFEFAYHTYVGIVVLIADDQSTIQLALDEFSVRPEGLQ